MNKRGQFFILGAIILALALFVLMVKLNTFDETVLIKDFYPLSENYKTESVKVVNDAIAQGGATTPNKALDDFTQKYLNYARTIDPNAGLNHLVPIKNIKFPTSISIPSIKNNMCLSSSLNSIILLLVSDS